MDILDKIDIITIVIICLFIIPILMGIIRTLTSDRVYRSLASILSTVLLTVALIFAVYLTRLLFSDSQNFIFTALYKVLPALEVAVVNNDILLYLLFVIIILMIVDGLLHLLTIPIYRYVLAPASDKASRAINSMNGFSRRLIGGLWKVPKSILLVLVFCLLLNFYCGIESDSVITKYANNSSAFKLVEENVIQPLLETSAVKNIRVILNDSFKAAGDEISDIAGRGQLTRYINGVTLDDAVESNPEIDAAAKKAVGSETNSRKKAYLIYKWICKNISYDNSKAEVVSKNPIGVSSGAIVAFNTRTGICFDYSSLYVAMCRAVGLKVRLITGLGYTGSAWGDHAWNQAYCTEEDRWINVDTTFGSTGINYFDRADFGLDHTDAVIQEEW